MSSTDPTVSKLAEINDKLKILSSNAETNALLIGSTIDSLKEINVTPADLKISGLNVLVADFRKSSNTTISNAAKNIITHWKSAQQPVSTSSTSTSLSPHSSSSVKSPNNSHTQPKSDQDNELVQLPPPTELTSSLSTHKLESNSSSKRSLTPAFLLGNAPTSSRNAGQRLIFNCFDESVETDFRTELAVQIELELFNHFKAESQDYKDRIRLLAANLKDPQNPDFKELILHGAISPTELAIIDQRQMASKAAQSRIAAEVDFELEKRKTDTGDGEGKGVDMFPCPQCKGRNTSYFQKQTRSADEPMTIFCRCLICNKRWRIY